MKGVKHYTKDGKEWKGKTHKHKDGTLMTDTVTYAMPFGWLGRLTHWVSVRHQLTSIFDYRERKLGQIFSEGKKYGVKI